MKIRYIFTSTLQVIFLVVFLSGTFFSLYAQNNNAQNDGGTSYIQTAPEFLEQIGEAYAGVEDLKATIQIDSPSGSSTGTIFTKPPNKMRINFTQPRGQVINNNGTDFYVYIPTQNVALHQKKRPITGGNVGGEFLTKTGLALLSKNYLASYFDKPQYIPWEKDFTKQVIKIQLRWRNTSQNFRSLLLYIGRDNIIYQVDAVTYNREEVTFIFSDIVINEGIPDSRFDYDPPPTAHVMDKFLFDEEEKIDE